MIWFCGDVHGRFDDALAECRNRTQQSLPAAIIFLGDLEPCRPLDEEFANFLELGIQPYFIIGNHDTDRRAYWNRIMTSGDRNLDGRVVEIGGIRVAGLGGVFRFIADVMPASYDDYARRLQQRSAIKHRLSRQDLLQRQAVPSPRTDAEMLELSRTGLLLKHRSTIFSDTIECLKDEMADILVSHEALLPHRYGHSAINELAAALQVQQVFHGHHHDDLDYVTADGINVYQIGYRGIADLSGHRIHAGQVWGCCGQLVSGIDGASKSGKA